jgi:carboxymethylenebutenolidase
MRDARIELQTADGPMAVYEAVPDGDARGAIIVIQEAFGVNDHIEDVTRRCADAGYVAVAPALFHRAGGGVAPYDDLAQIMPLFEGVTDEGVMTDVDATIDHLHDEGFSASAIGTIGFCFGGRVTFLVALRRVLGAGIGFYGGGITEPNMLIKDPLIDHAKELQTPWLGLFGDLDESIPTASVERLRENLAAALVPSEIVRYADAGHGFHCDARPNFHEPSARDGWRRAMEWFGTHLS